MNGKNCRALIEVKKEKVGKKESHQIINYPKKDEEFGIIVGGSYVKEELLRLNQEGIRTFEYRIENGDKETEFKQIAFRLIEV